MRAFAIMLFLSIQIFANLTKSDIKEIRSIVKEELDVRFELQQKYLDAKFEAIDAKFDAIDKRFEDMNKRFEDMNKRFEDMNKRFEMMDKRFDDQMNFLYIITAIFTTFTIGVIGFALWDRRTIIDKAKDVTIKEIENSKKFQGFIESLKHIAKRDKELEMTLKKYGIA